MNQAHVNSDVELTSYDRSIIKVLIVGVILPLMDTTLINMSLNDIGEQLAAPLSLTKWIVTGYTLAAAGAVPLSAWLAQRVGIKKLWLYCLWLFLVGTCLSAIANNVQFLIFSRILQGVATGILLPTMQTIVVIAIGRNKTKPALSAMSIPSVLAPVCGPLVAGLGLQFFDWRLLFWLHAPLCLVAIIFAIKWLPDIKKLQSTHFDSFGFLLFSPGLVLIAYGFSTLQTENTGNWLLILALGTALVSVFVWRGFILKGNSLIDPSIFEVENFKYSTLSLFLSSVAHYGGILLLPLSLIQVAGYGPNMAGLFLALHGCGTLLARSKLTTVSTLLGERNTAYVAVFLSLLGSLLLFPSPPLYNSLPLVATGMMLRGAGVGVLTILSMSGAYHGLTHTQVVHASAITRITTHLGATIGATLVPLLATVNFTVPMMTSNAYLPAHIAFLVVLIGCGWVSRSLPGKKAGLSG